MAYICRINTIYSKKDEFLIYKIRKNVRLIINSYRRGYCEQEKES